jgi:hypothetical protein
MIRMRIIIRLLWIRGSIRLLVMMNAHEYVHTTVLVVRVINSMYPKVAYQPLQGETELTLCS